MSSPLRPYTVELFLPLKTSWCPLMSAGHGVVSVCPARLPSSAPAHGQTLSPIPRFPPLLVLCWCSSLPCLQNSVFSDCGADNECWFISWLIAILCDLCSGGWEVFAYWVKRVPRVAALSSPPSVPRMSSAWKRHLAFWKEHTKTLSKEELRNPVQPELRLAEPMSHKCLGKAKKPPTPLLPPTPQSCSLLWALKEASQLR